jgi:hypothetical protein
MRYTSHTNVSMHLLRPPNKLSCRRQSKPWGPRVGQEIRKISALPVAETTTGITGGPRVSQHAEVGYIGEDISGYINKHEMIGSRRGGCAWREIGCEFLSRFRRAHRRDYHLKSVVIAIENGDSDFLLTNTIRQTGIGNLALQMLSGML